MQSERVTFLVIRKKITQTFDRFPEQKYIHVKIMLADKFSTKK